MKNKKTKKLNNKAGKLKKEAGKLNKEAKKSNDEIEKPKWIWCMRKGFAKRFMLSVSACTAYQENPKTKCNKVCKKEKNAMGIGPDPIQGKKRGRIKSQKSKQTKKS